MTGTPTTSPSSGMNSSSTKGRKRGSKAISTASADPSTMSSVADAGHDMLSDIPNAADADAAVAVVPASAAKRTRWNMLLGKLHSGSVKIKTENTTRATERTIPVFFRSGMTWAKRDGSPGKSTSVKLKLDFEKLKDAANVDVVDTMLDATAPVLCTRWKMFVPAVNEDGGRAPCILYIPYLDQSDTLSGGESKSIQAVAKAITDSTLLTDDMRSKLDLSLLRHFVVPEDGPLLAARILRVVRAFDNGPAVGHAVNFRVEMRSFKQDDGEVFVPNTPSITMSDAIVNHTMTMREFAETFSESSSMSELHISGDGGSSAILAGQPKAATYTPQAAGTASEFSDTTRFVKARFDVAKVHEQSFTDHESVHHISVGTVEMWPGPLYKVFGAIPATSAEVIPTLFGTTGAEFGVVGRIAERTPGELAKQIIADYLPGLVDIAVPSRESVTISAESVLYNFEPLKTRSFPVTYDAATFFLSTKRLFAFPGKTITGAPADSPVTDSELADIGASYGCAVPSARFYESVNKMATNSAPSLPKLGAPVQSSKTADTVYTFACAGSIAASFPTPAAASDVNATFHVIPACRLLSVTPRGMELLKKHNMGHLAVDHVDAETGLAIVTDEGERIRVVSTTDALTLASLLDDTERSLMIVSFLPVASGSGDRRPNAFVLAFVPTPAHAVV